MVETPSFLSITAVPIAVRHCRLSRSSLKPSENEPFPFDPSIQSTQRAQPYPDIESPRHMGIRGGPRRAMPLQRRAQRRLAADARAAETPRFRAGVCRPHARPYTASSPRNQQPTPSFPISRSIPVLPRPPVPLSNRTDRATSGHAAHGACTARSREKHERDRSATRNPTNRRGVRETRRRTHPFERIAAAHIPMDTPASSERLDLV